MSAESLGDALPREMARVRDTVLAVYLTLGPGGAPAAMLMRRDLGAAERALEDGDVEEMSRVYRSLTGRQL